MKVPIKVLDWSHRKMSARLGGDTLGCDGLIAVSIAVSALFVSPEPGTHCLLCRGQQVSGSEDCYAGLLCSGLMPQPLPSSLGNKRTE